jgi:ABC-type spermidine/putrescine transport system permease subunit II
MNPSEISALIIGAVIALISSLTATLVTSLFNHWLSRRSQRQEKIANLHYLMGKMTADVAKSDESVKVWREQKEHLLIRT